MRILVSGAGIAGLAAGINLGAFGHDVTIVEHADHLRTSGSPIDIRGDAIDITRRMGIYREIDKRRIVMSEHSRLFDDEGSVLGELSSAEVGDSAEDLEIPREDLTQLLTQSLPPSTSLIMSESIDRLHDDGEGVDVTFFSGISDRFDLVVGVDSMHSLTRKLVFGPEKDYLTHLGFYGANTKLPPEHRPDKNGYFLNWPVHLIGITHYHQTTLGVMNFCTPWINYYYRDFDEQKQILLDVYTDHDKWPVHEILDVACDDPELYFDSVSQNHMPAWHAGRVCARRRRCSLRRSLVRTRHVACDPRHLVPLSSLGSSCSRYSRGIVSVRGRLTRPYVTHAQDSAGPRGDLVVPDTQYAINARNKLPLTISS